MAIPPPPQPDRHAPTGPAAGPEPAIPADPSGDPALDSDLDLDLDLRCPTCDTALAGAAAWETWRVCPGCTRHFPLPARERLRLLLDAGSFVETRTVLVSLDPVAWVDRPPAAEAAPAEAPPDAVVTGIGAIGGVEAVVVALDYAFLGDGIGPVAGEKITLAFDLAAERRLPLVLLGAAGGTRGGGALTAWQAPRLAAAAARLHRAGIPIVGVLTQPTTAAVWGALLTQADVTLAEPGAAVECAPDRVGVPPPAAGAAIGAEALLAAGVLDGIVERSRLPEVLATLFGLFADRGEPPPVAHRRSRAAQDSAPDPRRQPPSWEMATLVRRPDRPSAVALVRRIVTDWVELRGDRLTGDDPAIVCGFGRLADVPVAAVAQQREQRATAAGWGKAARLLRLAGHLELPVVALLDAPSDGADVPADPAQLAAVGRLLALAPLLPVPLVAAIVGEGSGPAAAALAAGDRTLMLEHALLRGGGSRAGSPPAHDRPGEPLLAAAPVLTARDALRLGLVDGVVPEPAPAAHADPERAAALLAEALAATLADLAAIGPRRLLVERRRRVRCLGQGTPAGREAARLEVGEWQDVQRALARSVADLREKWQERGRLPRPTLPPLPPLPRRPDPLRWDAEPLARRLSDFADLAGRLAPLRPGRDARADPTGPAQTQRLEDDPDEPGAEGPG